MGGVIDILLDPRQDSTGPWCWLGSRTLVLGLLLDPCHVMVRMRHCAETERQTTGLDGRERAEDKEE
jgi:hypothetical protein